MTMTDLERPSKKRGATGAERLTSRTSIISMAFLFVMATYFLVPVQDEGAQC